MTEQMSAFREKALAIVHKALGEMERGAEIIGVGRNQPIMVGFVLADRAAPYLDSPWATYFSSTDALEVQPEIVEMTQKHMSLDNEAAKAATAEVVVSTQALLLATGALSHSVQRTLMASMHAHRSLPSKEDFHKVVAETVEAAKALVEQTADNAYSDLVEAARSLGVKT